MPHEVQDVHAARRKAPVKARGRGGREDLEAHETGLDERLESGANDGGLLPRGYGCGVARLGEGDENVQRPATRRGRGGRRGPEDAAHEDGVVREEASAGGIPGELPRLVGDPVEARREDDLERALRGGSCLVPEAPHGSRKKRLEEDGAVFAELRRGGKGLAPAAVEGREDAFVHRDDDAHALSRGATLRLERLDDARPSEAREKVRGCPALSTDQDELEAAHTSRHARGRRRGRSC